MRPLLVLGLVPLVGCIDTQISAVSTKVAANPALLDLGTVPPLQSGAGLVSVSSVGQGTITITSVTVAGNDADLFTIDEDVSGAKLAKGEAIDVPVTFTPTTVGRFEADLTVQTDANSGDAAVVLHLRGIGATPELVVAPRSLDFGYVDPGADVFASVTLQSTGPVDATLETAAVTGDSTFYLDALTAPAVVGSGGSLVLTVGFGATDHDAQAAHLKLTTDDPALPSLSIPIIANTCVGAGAEDGDADGWSACAGDCADADATVYPDAPETLDGVDDDCDGTVDEGTSGYDDDGDGYSEAEGDCADADPGVSPVAVEVADGIDQDCDGLVDDTTNAYDDDGDGTTEDGGDCDDAASDTHPGAEEVADGVDNDCDGTVDEGTPNYDDDGDGYTEAGGDCDDTTSAIGPHRLEVTGDGIDNDCDGVAE